MATMTTTIRLEPSLKEECCSVLQEMGMTLSGAINLFLKQVIITRSIPFEIRAGNPPPEIRRRLDRIVSGKEKMSQPFNGSTEDLMKELLDA